MQILKKSTFFQLHSTQFTSCSSKSCAPPNGHDLSDMHVQSMLIFLSEARAPSFCSAIQSHVTCFSLIVNVTCQINLGATGKIGKQSELICDAV